MEIKKTNFPPLLQLSYVLQQQADEILEREAGIGLSAARIMSVLDRHNAVSQRVIAASVRQTESNISRQLHNMRQKGLVIVTKNRKDNRQRDVVLSPEGSIKYQFAEKLLVTQQKNLLNHLSTGEVKILESAALVLS